jgi:arylsulfatase A-like enzyme
MSLRPLMSLAPGWRRLCLLFCAGMLGLLTEACAVEPSRVESSLSGSRPNIIFILTDDQGYGDISAHGNPILKTPNLDRLHREGARFTDFQASPTCAPTRAALMTGRHEFRGGVTHTIAPRDRLRHDAVTLPMVLSGAGYKSACFGKWHLGDERESWPDRRGFEYFLIHGYGGVGQDRDAPGNRYFDPVLNRNGKLEKTRGYCADVYFENALAWIDEARKGTQPFFCYIASNTPHIPLEVRPEDEARYAGLVDDPQVAKFFGMLANIDDNVGRVLDRLAEWGLERDTLVIFMNDNGGTIGCKVFNDGMRGQKVTAWRGGTRAASFWRWPGKIAPGDRQQLAAHLDFLPTLAAFAGAPISEEVAKKLEGRSLIPLLEKADAPWEDRTLYTHVGRWRPGQRERFKYTQAAVRTSQWSLVSDARPGEAAAWKLFELKSDPGQQKDVSAEHPEEFAKLVSAFETWWESLEGDLVNEDAPSPPNTYEELYLQQFGLPGPNNVDPATIPRKMMAP